VECRWVVVEGKRGCARGWMCKDQACNGHGELVGWEGQKVESRMPTEGEISPRRRTSAGLAYKCPDWPKGPRLICADQGSQYEIDCPDGGSVRLAGMKSTLCFCATFLESCAFRRFVLRRAGPCGEKVLP
jgi:hypothetical protein